MKRLCFPKKLRLLTSNDFLFVFKKPSKTTTKNIIILSRKNILKHPRIGLIISKKKIKKSYKRNHIKRLIRESFRINQHILPNMDFVILIQQDIYDIHNNTLKQELQNIWKWHFCYQ